MKTSIRQLFLGAAVACFFTLTFVALAQDDKKTSEPSAPPAQAAPAPAPAQTTSSAAATPEPEKPATAPAAIEEKKESELRRIDSPTPQRPSRARVHHGGNGNARVAIGNDIHLAPGEDADAVVAIAGNATSEGDVADAVVAVMGNATVTQGSVGDAVVSVMGRTYVNTKIGGDAVAVMGDLELGPNAEIGGEVVSVGGTVRRDPQAIVHGSVQNIAISSHFPKLDGLQTWFRECLLMGRPLAFKTGLGFVWGFTLAFFALYVLLALIFGGPVEKCAVTLETKPGGSLLAALLTILLTPVLIVLLCVTVIGIAVIPFLVIALILAAMFGKTVMLAWVGRRFTKFFGSGPLTHPAFATLIGAAIVILLYTVPFLGIILQKTFDVIGLGVVVYTLMLASKKAKPAAPIPPAHPIAPVAPVTPTIPPTIPPIPASGFVSGEPAPASGVMPPMSPGFGAAGPSVAVPSGAMPFAMPMAAAAGGPAAAIPPISAATLPRAGFWIRIGALALDAILVAVIVALIHVAGPKVFFLALAGYAAVMWKLKGTTIGGIVCGLKVVRIDDREVDWATAIVRALSCFLSIAVAGLGFIWIAIDDDKQAWHDKIAGTTVVSMPKGVSLL